MNGIAIPFVYADPLFTEIVAERKRPRGAVADVLCRLSVVMLVDCDTELFAEDGFDAIHVVFHKREIFFHVCHALQEFFQRSCQSVELLREALFQRGEALVHCR